MDWRDFWADRFSVRDPFDDGWSDHDAPEDRRAFLRRLRGEQRQPEQDQPRERRYTWGVKR